MAEELDPIKTLTSAKEKLIEERRELAVTLALRRRRIDDQATNETCRSFINLQELIEAIDRAIAHENGITSEQTESITVSALEATRVQ
jgi:hypothetical protein